MGKNKCPWEEEEEKEEEKEEEEEKNQKKRDQNNNKMRNQEMFENIQNKAEMKQSRNKRPKNTPK